MIFWAQIFEYECILYSWSCTCGLKCCGIDWLDLNVDLLLGLATRRGVWDWRGLGLVTRPSWVGIVGYVD